MSGKYDDIIDLPHHVSPVRARMSAHDRAAQFSPFAALTGYEDVIRETARPACARREMDEQAKNVTDSQLRYISERIKDNPEVEIEYFVSDLRKDGGSYHIRTGRVGKIDLAAQKMIFEDGTEIEFNDIRELRTGK